MLTLEQLTDIIAQGERLDVEFKSDGRTEYRLCAVRPFQWNMLKLTVVSDVNMSLNCAELRKAKPKDY